MSPTEREIASSVKALLEDRAIDQKTLAEAVGMSESALSRALNGERRFKAIEVARIAEALGESTSALLEGPIKQSTITVAARRSSGERQPVRDALARVSFLASLAEILETRRRPDDLRLLPNSATKQPWRQGEGVADRFLQIAGLGGGDVLPTSMHDLAAKVETTGIQVALEPLGGGLDGMSAANERFWLALVSTAVAPARQRWTLAHEIAHLVLGDTEDFHVDENVWSGRTAQETRANAFAAAFLMPADSMRDRASGLDLTQEDAVVKLLDTFHVSLDALAFRLHNLSLVNAAGRDAIRNMRPLLSMLRNQGTRQSEAMWLPSGLTSDAVDAYRRGDLGVRWLAELMQISADELLSRLGANRQEVEAFEAVEEAYAG